MRMGFAAAGMAAALVVSPAFAAKEAQTPPIQTVIDAPADAWRTIDPENLLIVDLPAGPIAIEMRPDIAPKHIEHIKTLVRRGFYNGLRFHRVIENFVAQGGDPKGDGTGGSDLPNVPAEFIHDTNEVENFTVIGRDRQAARVGMIDGVLAAAEPESLRSFRNDKHVYLWGAHCPGVMSMARSTDPNSANSQFFLVIGDARQSLDGRYTVWGWIVDGVLSARRIERGEPPKRPTPIVRMRIAADMPASERPNIKVMKTDHPSFLKFIKEMGYVDDTGFVKDLCDIKAPRKIDGKIEL
ncbi:MAG TPA: peptidylprolyl isomerase [Parvularculaceae bacterium]|nr:peptidylprolyl isomerase [Parvularculaceae bacterium]